MFQSTDRSNNRGYFASDRRRVLPSGQRAVVELEQRFNRRFDLRLLVTLLVFVFAIGGVTWWFFTKSQSALVSHEAHRIA